MKSKKLNARLSSTVETVFFKSKIFLICLYTFALTSSVYSQFQPCSTIPPTSITIHQDFLNNDVDDLTEKGFTASLPTGTLSNECYNDDNILELSFDIVLPNQNEYEVFYSFRTNDFEVVALPPNSPSISQWTTFNNGDFTFITGILDFSTSTNSDIGSYCYNVHLKFADTFAPPQDNLDEINYTITNITDTNNPIQLNVDNDFFLPNESDFVNTLTPGNHSIAGATVFDFVIHNFFLSSCQTSINGFDLNMDGVLTVDGDICVFDDDFQSNFYMGENSNIIIEPGNEALFRNVKFHTCGSDWGSIIVRSGAKLNLIDCDFSNVSYPVILENGAELNLKGTSFTNTNTAVTVDGNAHMVVINNNFTNCSESAIEINDDITHSGFEDNTFTNNGNGILVNGGAFISIYTKPTGEFPNIFNNNNYGIRVLSGSANIAYNEFYDNTVGIYSEGDGVNITNNIFETSLFSISLNTTGYSDIHENIFDDDIRSITGTTGMFNIRDNIIGQTESCSEGILLMNTGASAVLTNTLYVENRGISTSFSSGGIIGNIIDVENVHGISGYYHSGDIHGNIIDCGNTNTGIALTNMLGSGIHNNTLYIDAADAGIDMQSCDDLEVFQNLIIGGAVTGINCNNSPHTDIICNEYDGAVSGLVTEGASMDLTIQTNVFTDCSQADLYVSSAIGIQSHQGNIFSGEAFSDLPIFDFDRFRYDSNVNSQFEPTDFTTGFFVFADDGNSSEFCTGSIGGSNNFYQNNPTALCQLIQRMNTLKNNDIHFNEYWIFMYNLIRHYKADVPVSNWPSCFRSFVDQLDDCGLIKLIDLEVRLIKSLRVERVQSEALSPKINRLKELYLTYDGSRSIEQEIVSLQQEISARMIQIKNRKAQIIQVIKNQTRNVICTKEIVQVWKFVFMQNLKLLLNNEISEQNKNLLINTASLCLDEYGNPVAAARAILSHMQDIAIQDSSDCAGGRISSRSESEENKIIKEVVVNPNPFFGQFNISFDNAKYQNIIIRKIDGAVLYETSDLNDNMTISLENASPGIYILQLVKLNGDIDTKKIIKQ